MWKKRAYQKYQDDVECGNTVLMGWLYAIGFYIAQSLSITNPKLRRFSVCVCFFHFVLFFILFYFIFLVSYSIHLNVFSIFVALLQVRKRSFSSFTTFQINVYVCVCSFLYIFISFEKENSTISQFDFFPSIFNLFSYALILFGSCSSLACMCVRKYVSVCFYRSTGLASATPSSSSSLSSSSASISFFPFF